MRCDPDHPAPSTRSITALLTVLGLIHGVFAADGETQPVWEQEVPARGRSHSPSAPFWDDNGYITWCPCMGRFGNQFSQLLGSLALAKAINRTVILPHWVVYGKKGTVFPAFDDILSVDSVAEYHRVIRMDDFMRLFGDRWPPERRTGFCVVRSCQMKEGSPFGPYWDHWKIDFVDTTVVTQSRETPHKVEQLRRYWQSNFPADRYPVAALKGPPGSFPVEPFHRSIQAHLRWSATVLSLTNALIASNLRAPFVGIHLRNNVDWSQVCERHLNEEGTQNLFESPQCAHLRPRGPLKREMCWPPADMVAGSTVAAVKKVGARSVFVASDKDCMRSQIKAALEADAATENVVVVCSSDVRNWLAQQSSDASISAALKEALPFVLDVAVLEQSAHFIGNCLSSFSAIVARARRYSHEPQKPTEFWGVDRIDSVAS